MRAGNGFLVGTGDVGGVYRAAPARRAAGDVPVEGARRRVPVALGPAALARHARAASRRAPATRPSPTRPGPASRALEQPRATAEGGAARWRARPRATSSTASTLRRAEGRARDVTLAYLPQNQRARVTELDARPTAPPRPRGGWARAAAATARAGSARALAGLKLRWKVENPDGDELIYRLSFREENEAVWRPLGGPDPLTKPEYDWNTEGMPDGNYVVRVIASDERVAARASGRSTLRSCRRRSWSTTASPRCVGLAAQVPVRLGPRARRPEPAHRDRVLDRRRRLAAARRPPTASATTCVESFTLQAAAAGARAARGHRARLGQRRQRRRRGGITMPEVRANDAPGARRCAGCRRRPRSCRSRSASSRTSARSSTAPRRARRRSSTRPGRSTACCARRSGWTCASRRCSSRTRTTITSRAWASWWRRPAPPWS